jgi:hypothetical protein
MARVHYRSVMKATAALGLVPHTGWTWLVRVRRTDEGVAVERRERVVACDVLEGELYHLAVERAREQEQFLATRRTAALRQAQDALSAHVEGVRHLIVLGKRMTLPPLERILAAHPLIHGAEGELWRALFAEAGEALGLLVERQEASAVRAALAKRHAPAAVQAFLAAGKKAVGAPWSREPQEAALAAWSALARPARS